MRMPWLRLTIATALLATVPFSAAAAERPAPADPRAPWQRCVFTPTPDSPAARPVRPPTPYARRHGTARVTLSTNRGTIELRLDRANAPCAVHNLVHLARGGFYHRTQCFRLTNSPRLGVLQCGDIWAAEKGGPGYKFDDELTGQEKYPRGTVAMGNFGPDTNGSQFFLVHSQALIKPAYTVLGTVTRGLDVLDAIVADGITPGEGGNPQDGSPARPVRIRWVTVSR